MLQNLKRVGIVLILTETRENRKMRAEVAERTETKADMAKVLIG
jgi:hypothetical protein